MKQTEENKHYKNPFSGVIQVLHTSEVINIFKISERQLIHWCERGLVHPVVDARGPGSRRAYDYFSLLEIGLVKALVDSGVKFQEINQIIKEFYDKSGFEKWFDNFDEFYKTLAEKQKKKFLGHDEEYIKNKLRGARPVGALYWLVLTDGSKKLLVDPLSMGTQDITVIKDILPQATSMIAINLGIIKKNIDREEGKIPVR
jgi:DNA-binding transcriptional MerR regulator